MRIGGMTAALRGLSLHQARFEQAAARVTERASPDGTAAMSDATVGMAAARYAMLASLRAAQATNEMVADAVRGV
jgi:hypothetical protein